MPKSNFSSTFTGKGQVDECFIVLKPLLTKTAWTVCCIVWSYQNVMSVTLLPSCQLPETTLTNDQTIKTIIDALATPFALSN